MSDNAWLRQDEIVRRLSKAVFLLSPEALDIIEAVLAGAIISDGRRRTLPVGSIFETWREWTVSTRKSTPCPECGGSGNFEPDPAVRDCPICKGTGEAK